MALYQMQKAHHLTINQFYSDGARVFFFKLTILLTFPLLP